MHSLKYKTRAMRSPVGKTNVYICADVKDGLEHIESVSEEILKRHNCAVWYKDEKEGECDTDAFFSDLEEMRLFVLPVTKKALASPSVREEFEFAIRQRIPVLPLMQESNLSAEFNRVFGNLQYLSRFESDTFGISYDDKLTKYLSAVVIGDGDADRVRGAFGHFVFLSYRKKDRRYARELMRLIHKKKSCFDIAVWYDEFLVPGEDFNDSISEKLERCELMAMVVTPSTLEEGNYIASVEYPMAREKNKTVIPVEFQSTNAEKLSESFDGIGECISADEESVFDAIGRGLDISREPAASPERDYLIGLAYLSGICVEADGERALALITSAADAGLIEAYERLIDMYSLGDGVERSPLQSALWREKLLSLRMEIYRREPTVENGLLMVDEELRLGYDVERLGMPSLAFDMYNRAGVRANILTMDDTGKRVWFAYGRAQLYAASLLCTEQEMKKAKGYAVRAVQMFGEYVPGAKGDVSESDTDYFHACSLMNMGRIYFYERELDKATEYFERARDICTKYNDTCMERMCYKCLSFEIPVYMARGELYAAKRESELLLGKYHAYLERMDDCDVREDLANMYKCRAEIEQQIGSVEEAMRYFSLSEDIYIEFHSQSGDIAYKKKLCDSYRMKSKMLIGVKRIDVAGRWISLATEYARDIAKTDESVDARHTLSECLRLLGLVYSSVGDTEKARECLLECVSIAKKLADAHSSLATLEALADAYVSCACVDLQSLDFRMLEMAQRLLGSIAEEYPDAPNITERERIVKGLLDTV